MGTVTGERLEPKSDVHRIANESELSLDHAAVGDLAGVEGHADFLVGFNTFESGVHVRL